MRKKILVAALAAASIAVVAPSMASAATAVPPLTSGATQGFITNALNVAQAGSFTATGPLVLSGAASISCSSNSFGVSYTTAGTGTVTSFTAGGCAVSGFPSCPVSITPTDLPWGVRINKGGSTPPFTLDVNTSFHIVFGSGTPTCPAPAGTYNDTGLLSPMLSVSGGVISAAFDAGSGSVTGPLGSATVSGTVSGTLPAGSTKLN